MKKLKPFETLKKAKTVTNFYQKFNKSLITKVLKHKYNRINGMVLPPEEQLPKAKKGEVVYYTFDGKLLHPFRVKLHRRGVYVGVDLESQLIAGLDHACVIENAGAVQTEVPDQPHWEAQYGKKQP